MNFETEINNFIKVWTIAIISLSYCYYVSSKLPKGIPRLLSILPIISLFFILPLNLSTIHLCGPTAFFLVWLANSKLILFAFDQGPLSQQPHNLFTFISIACLPIKVKQSQISNFDNNQLKPINPIKAKQSKTPIERNPKSKLLIIKFILLILIFQSYNYKQSLSQTIILFRYCCHMYLELEIMLAISAFPARAVLGFEIEPQFNEPYLATSLQDFWGKRWNLMVPTILHPTVYSPTRRVASSLIGNKWAPVAAVLASFLVSGLFHELIYYYFTHVRPTWEVTWFFVLHGVCMGLEIVVKRSVEGKWRLWRGVSGLLTVGFVAVTGAWLFFPQVLRNGVDQRAISEYQMVVAYVSDHLLPRLTSFLR